MLVGWYKKFAANKGMNNLMSGRMDARNPPILSQNVNRSIEVFIINAFCELKVNI